MRLNQIRSSFAPCAGAMLFLAVAFGIPSRVEADYLVNTYDGSSLIYTLNPDTGAATIWGSPTGVGVTLTDIALAPNGQLYGASLTDFYSINTITGAASLIGSFGATTSMVGLEVTSSGQIFGVGGAGFFQVNPATGAATLQFNTPYGYFGDVAHASGNLFYATDNNAAGTHLIELNAGTLTATDRGLIAAGEYSPGLDFDPLGRLIAFSINGTAFEIPNYATSGAGTILSDTAIIYAGATTLPVPEPSTLTLLGFAVGGTLVMKRRKVACSDQSRG